ncbi:MAG TPA: hypothetical protein PLJ47_18540, partial [Candidatus Hydrogenedentes bacterium]|nr:hypothetical protein [Candidatus Hydrogenedentota bacterium]
MTRAFSPVVALVRRELLTASRQNVLALGLCLIVLLGCSFALAGWPAGDRQLMANLPTSTSVILALLFSLLMAFGQLGTALLACASYFVERDEETLDCLSMAGISSLQLVIGKAIAACAFSVFAGVAVVPIGATVFFMVGVDVATLLGYTALLLVSVFTAASIGIASAAIVRNPYAGALLAMAAVFVQGGWCFFLFVVIGEALNLIPGDVGTLMTPSPYLFPLLSSLALASHAPGSWVAMFSCCLTCCVVSALCLGFASSALARSRSKERAPGAAKVSPHREFSDMRNPVLALESIVGAAQHRRAWLGILGALGVALFVVWLAVLASFLQSGRNASFIEGIVAFFSLQQLLLPVVLIPWSVHLFAKDYRGHALN